MFPAKPLPMCADLRFAKPRKFPKGNGFILFASTKRTKSSRRAAALSTPGKRFKTLRNIFFVTFPALVPKPVYGATLFFGGFEPVRKGSCSADARPLFFENGLLYSQAHRDECIRRGQLHVIFAAVGICFCGMLIESFDLK